MPVFLETASHCTAKLFHMRILSSRAPGKHFIVWFGTLILVEKIVKRIVW